MSADVLRRAASLMRGRAEAATPGPWFTNAGVKQVEVVSDEDDLIYRRVRDMQAPRDAEHIASWHPAVALAVADWLEVTASDVGTSSLAFHAALAVARAYLGADA